MTKTDFASLIFAYYLPQFHPTALNSEHWGEGYTEWNALLKAHSGSRSPKDLLLTPGKLGFYDLRSIETRSAQATLAKRYGLDAFCIYHYYSDGIRPMVEVEDAILEDGEPNHPFFYCWANHDWTLAWIGKPNSIIFSQKYSKQYSDAHIEMLISAFHDKRYVKINNSPVLSIYDVKAIPDASRMFDSWREKVRDAGFGDLILLSIDQAEQYNSRKLLGFNGTVQGAAPVIKSMSRSTELIRHRSLVQAARSVAFGDAAVSSATFDSASEQLRMKDGTQVPLVISSWNSVGRRNRRAWYLTGASVARFETALRTALHPSNALTLGQSELEIRAVAVNAWNEWGEGMAIEPSQESGTGFLESLARVSLALRKGELD